MRDEGGGKDGLALETASRLFPQHFPAPVPQCGGGGRTIRGVPQKAAWPPACLPAATPASRPPSPAAILGPGGRTTAPSALGAAAPSCRRQRGRGAAAAGTWRCSRPSPGPPSQGSPPPAAPRAPREVKSWENRPSLNSSPAALGTRRRPRSGRVWPRSAAAAGAVLPPGSGPSPPEAAERGTGALGLSLVLFFSFSFFHH